MKVITMSPMNVIVAGTAGQITYTIQVGDMNNGIFTPDPNYAYVVKCDGSPLNDGTYHCTLNGSVGPLNGVGDMQLVVDYKYNPYNTPYCTNIVIESKTDPAHVYLFNKFTQSIGTGEIDNIGDQRVPPDVTPNWPPNKTGNKTNLVKGGRK